MDFRVTFTNGPARIVRDADSPADAETIGRALALTNGHKHPVVDQVIPVQWVDPVDAPTPA